MLLGGARRGRQSSSSIGMDELLEVGSASLSHLALAVFCCNTAVASPPAFDRCIILAVMLLAYSFFVEKLLYGLGFGTG